MLVVRAHPGNYFEGRFPVMIRRQKVLKGGGSPSLSVDRIGGDRADISSLTPRSARINGTGVSSSVGSMSFGGGGGASANGVDDAAQPLTPLDLTVGKQVLLMKRPMTVCGWDETAHVWWERLTGESRPVVKSGRGVSGVLVRGVSQGRVVNLDSFTMRVCMGGTYRGGRVWTRAINGKDEINVAGYSNASRRPAPLNKNI